MTFIQFCAKQYITENDRQRFKDFLGSAADYERSELEWWTYFRAWQNQLLKNKAREGR